MKRDVELIRKLAFIVEEAQGDVYSLSIGIEGYTTAQIAYHCELMREADLIKCIDVGHLGSQHPEFVIRRLTSKGHDFADAARNDTIWNKSIATIKKTAGAVTIDLLIQYLKVEARRVLGLPGEE